jgi:hypothetical protein
MITQITEGMSPAQFRSALNANFALTYPNFTTVTSLTTPNLQIVLNTNFSKSDNYVGIRGSSFAWIINNNFNEFDDASKPTNLTVSWIDDYAQMDFTDNTGGLSQHEIWESKNSGIYKLVTTLAAGVETYKNYTAQNASVNFTVRAKQGSNYSVLSNVANLVTPWVFRCNQSTLTTLNIYELRMKNTADKTVHIDWGDGTSIDWTNIEYNVGPSKTYTVEKDVYFIKISGDANYIVAFQLYENLLIAGTVVTKWNLPNYTFFCHFYGDGLVGDLTEVLENLPLTINGVHFADNNLTGDITNVRWDNKPGWWDCHLSSCGLTGDITGKVLGPELAHFTMGYNFLTGNPSSMVLPQTASYGDYIIEFSHNNFDSADWSGMIIGHKTGDFEINYLPITGLPRGYFENMGLFSALNCNCNSSAIDAFLAYLDGYFVGGVVPLANCVYTLNGSPMGSPSAAGLVSRSSIIAKYVAQGKTCSILVNS